MQLGEPWKCTYFRQDAVICRFLFDYNSEIKVKLLKIK